MLAVMVLSGLCEGFGMALFAPVIELMGGSGEESWILSGLRRAFAIIGLEVSLPTTLALITSLIAGAFALNYLQARLLIRAKNRQVTRIRGNLFDQVFRAEWGYLSTQSHGEIVNLLVAESVRYGQTLMYQVRIVATIFLILAYAAISAALSWELLLFVMVAGCAFLAMVRPLFHRAKFLGEETTGANRDFSFHAVEFLKGAKLIKVTAAETSIIARFAAFNEKLFGVTFDAENINELTYFFLQTLPVVTLATVIIFAHEILEIGTSFIFVFLLIMARMMPRLAQLQQHYQQYVLRQPAVPLIDGVLAQSRDSEEELGQGRQPFTSLEKGIDCDNVSFRYPDGSGPALDHVSLHIGRNQMVALVGGSGSGKSTLVDMLAGLRRPDTGTVRIDCVNLSEMNLASWRRSIGYVTQETTVFNDTARNNLLFAHPEASDADIARCLEIAHLTEVIQARPKGLDTILGEGGVILSGGEKQRLALARALIGRPALLLLDEATSALDNESERIVQKAIENIAHRMTIFVVAHRLSTVRKADVIYVLEDGRIVERGTYDELLAKKGRFAELHELQFA